MTARTATADVAPVEHERVHAAVSAIVWLAPFSLGEAWHNNHHAFPTSAAHGLRWWEVDLSAWVIRGPERLGLASDAVRVEPQRQRTKAVAPAS